MNFKALLSTVSSKVYTLPIVILYVTEACNLKCLMCSYRERLLGELSLEEITVLAEQLEEFGLRRIVYSGGEPLLRKDLPDICNVFRSRSTKQTLLTNGVLLASRIGEIARFLDEVIISVDGGTAAVHDEIRGVSSFDRIIDSIPLVKQFNPSPRLSIRTVVQRKNFREIPKIIQLGLDLKVNRVSFLPTDLLTDAFGRDPTKLNGLADLQLTPDEVKELREIILMLSIEKAHLFASGFISESFSKLMSIADYFEALANGRHFPRVYCNAPMASAVITSTGDLLPCYFLPSVGNIRETSLLKLLNSEGMQRTRSDVRAYDLERCQTCVCSLNVSAQRALLNAF